MNPMSSDQTDVTLFTVALLAALCLVKYLHQDRASHSSGMSGNSSNFITYKANVVIGVLRSNATFVSHR